MDEVKDAAEAAGDHPVVRTGARVGYAVNGVVHLLIGWLGVQLALGQGGEDADQSGALKLLAANPLGWAVLLMAGASFALLALWQATEIVHGDLADRAKALGKAVAYGVIGWGAVELAFEAGESAQEGSAEDTADITAALMGLPFGTVLVGAVGVAVIAVGGYHVWKGGARRFLRDLVEHPGRFAEVAGVLGYIAKGVAIAVAGGLFLLAAAQHDPEESRGLDGALTAFLKLPYGQWIVLAIAVGFAAYAFYAFARARFARL